MNYSNLITKFKEVLSGDEFVDLFLVPINNLGKLNLIINDMTIKECPNNVSNCNLRCYDCWRNELESEGYVFEDYQETEF